MDKQQTLVMGASPNPKRYSYKAVELLQENDLPVLAFGIREGNIGDVAINTGLDSLDGQHLDTISLYLAPSNQQQYYDWILAANPQRVIFNPGTENREFEQLLAEKGIEPLQACTLVMLKTGQYSL